MPFSRVFDEDWVKRVGELGKDDKAHEAMSALADGIAAAQSEIEAAGLDPDVRSLALSRLFDTLDPRGNIAWATEQARGQRDLERVQAAVVPEAAPVEPVPFRSPADGAPAARGGPCARDARPAARAADRPRSMRLRRAQLDEFAAARGHGSAGLRRLRRKGGGVDGPRADRRAAPCCAREGESGASHAPLIEDGAEGGDAGPRARHRDGGRGARGCATSSRRCRAPTRPPPTGPCADWASPRAGAWAASGAGRRSNSSIRDNR